MTDSISNIDVEEALGAIGDGALILDVREDDEWSAGRIDGAIHVRLSELPDRFEELDRSRTIVCVCRVGGRSGRAAHFLANEGFETLNLDGGMTAWSLANQPMICDEGVARVI